MREKRKYGNMEMDEAEEYMILSHLISDYTLFLSCLPILDRKVFNGPFRAAFEAIASYEDEYRHLPDKTFVLGKSGVALEDVAIDKNHVEAIIDVVEGFVRRRKAEQFLLAAADKINGDLDRNELETLVKDMQDIASLSVKRDIGYEYLSDIDDLLATADKSSSVPTGMTLLDEVLGGGVTTPSYNIISAASGEGKSIGLQNLAINNSLAGINSVYITLELPEFMVEMRLLAMLSGLNIRSILKEKMRLKSIVSKGMNDLGLIQIKRFPIRGTSVADIRSYVNELESETGVRWDRIFIDYPDLMRPTRNDIKADNIHLWDKAIAEEIYEWAHDKNSPRIIWGASQQVKGAKDEKKARQSGVAGSSAKPNTADNLLIFKRGKGEHADKTWCFIEKGRNGGTGTIVPFHWNQDSQRWSCGEELRDLMEEINETGDIPDDNASKPKGMTPAQALVNQALSSHGINSSDEDEGAKGISSLIMEMAKERRNGSNSKH